MSAGEVAHLLADPSRASAVREADWTGILCAARAERLLGSLAERLGGIDLPERVRLILDDARAEAEAGRIHALWEAEMARRALEPLGMPVVLLKGTAFVAAGLDAGRGRAIGDLDILVPRDRLDEAEAALLAAGWEWVKPDPYDDAYYRKWMHELPPLIHQERDRMIDVHHTILPLTARPKPDAAALIADSLALENGLRVLSPEDMVVHAAAHLFADGDLTGGLRNLWDIDRLIREFGGDAFEERLAEGARLHGLSAEVDRALRLCARVFPSPSPSGVWPSPPPGRTETGQTGLGWGLSTKSPHPTYPTTPTPTPPLKGRGLDQLYAARLTARDDWGRGTRPLLRFAFYVRSHWIRMPPLMLARHLWIKWRRPAS